VRVPRPAPPPPYKGNIYLKTPGYRGRWGSGETFSLIKTCAFRGPGEQIGRFGEWVETTRRSGRSGCRAPSVHYWERARRRAVDAVATAWSRGCACAAWCSGRAVASPNEGASKAPRWRHAREVVGTYQQRRTRATVPPVLRGVATRREGHGDGFKVLWRPPAGLRVDRLHGKPSQSPSR